MKKGFTLIELLAVIVILAIIALIAVPIVLGIINSSKEESRRLSKELYLRAVNQAITAKNLDEYFEPESCTVNEYGNLTCTENEKTVELTIDVDGERPCSGDITFEGRKIKKETLSYCDESNKPEPKPEPEPEKSFATDDWTTIISNVKGKHTENYHVGDTKEIELADLGTHIVRISNMSDGTEEGCGGAEFSETACGFVIEFADIISEHVMNTNDTSAGGWESSEMRTYLNGESDSLLKALPQELQDGIIDTRVVSGHESGVSDNYTTTDKLYLLSIKEIYETDGGYDSATNETRQLDYYKQIGVTGSKYSGAIKKYNGSADYWWLRTANPQFTESFSYVYSDGNWTGDNASSAYGVAPAFRLG